MVFHTRIEALDADLLGDILSRYLPQKAIISSTRAIPEFITEMLSSHDVDVTYLTKETKKPFKIDYNTLESLGSDRIAAVAGGRVLFPKKDLLIIDSWDGKIESMDGEKSRFMTTGAACHKDYSGYRLRVLKS